MKHYSVPASPSKKMNSEKYAAYLFDPICPRRILNIKVYLLFTHISLTCFRAILVQLGSDLGSTRPELDDAPIILQFLSNQKMSKEAPIAT
jgi:hypothetical protein